MRLIRNTGETITAADDGRIIKNALGDGLFESVEFTISNGQINIPAFKGALSGRDFTFDAQSLVPTLPTTSTPVTGQIIVRIDLSSETPLSLITVLDPYELTYDDLNESGVVCEMKIATYTASLSGVISVTSAANNVINIAEKVNSLTEDSSWKTIGQHIVYRIINKIVYLRVRQAGGDMRRHGYVFGTLPSGVYPVFSFAEANVYGVGRVFINQNHTVTFETSSESESANYIQATFVYPLG